MLAVRPPSPAAIVAIASAPIRLGMPHMGPKGLSEAWLLRELGDRHWQGLAGHLGRRPSDLTDRDGHRVYAAFRSVRMEGLDLSRAREDGCFDVATSLARLSRTQVLSTHALFVDRHAVGTVTMVTAFIRREVAGQNARVARTPVEGLDMLPDVEAPDASVQPPSGAPVRPADCAGEVTFTPCPDEDFNGAGFLYFPAYVAFANRASCAILGRPFRDGALRGRRVTYFGNVDDGVPIIVRVCVPVPVSGGTEHRCAIIEAGTDRPLALVEALVGA